MFRISRTRFPRGLTGYVRTLSRGKLASAGGIGLALSCLIVAGCGGNLSPFLALQFAQNTIGTNLPNRPSPPTSAPSDGGGGGTNGTIDSVCDVEAAERTIQVTLQNEAQQPVQFAMTFVVSAGPGGFVCDEELSNYLNAGYVDMLSAGETQKAVGCDTISLAGGTRLLKLEFGIRRNQRLDVVGTAGASLPLTTKNNLLDIPVPELIVFGDSDPKFRCIGTNPCTQPGFVYVSQANLQVGKAAEASRIQGTLCAESFGNAPEWLLDKTTNNGSLDFHYVSGGTITATVLDRSGDSLTVDRNQVVWQVLDASEQTVIHFPEP